MPNAHVRPSKSTILLLAACVVGAAFGALLRPGVLSIGGRTDPIELRVKREGSAFDISWDRSSRQLRTARRGRLLLDDGSSVRTLDLDPAALREGHVVYAPVRPDLNIRLEVVDANLQTSTATVVILGGAQDTQSAAPVIPTVVVPEPVRPEMAFRTAPPVVSADRVVKQTRVFRPPAPVAIAATPALAAPEAAALQPITSDPLRPGQLPALKPPPDAPRLPRYVEPVAIRHSAMRVPPIVRAALSEKIVITVKVTVTRTGAVGKIQSISITGNPGPYIAELRRAAASTVREFVFRPGTLNGIAIESSEAIQFVIAQ